jgi:hypothetical protein
MKSSQSTPSTIERPMIAAAQSRWKLKVEGRVFGAGRTSPAGALQKNL